MGVANEADAFGWRADDTGVKFIQYGLTFGKLWDTVVICQKYIVTMICHE